MDIVERLAAIGRGDFTPAQALLAALDAKAEIERLREALRLIADTDPDDGTDWFHSVARAALGQESPT